jgi:predicted nucleic acid-binding protein
VIVTDASAVIDALLDPEGHPGLAETIAGAGEPLAAPNLLDVEVQSVLRRWERRGEIDATRARLALDDLASLPVVRHPALAVLDEAWALRHDVTAYDAQYIALAQVLSAGLLTTDAGMAQAARRAGLNPVC